MSRLRRGLAVLALSLALFSVAGLWDWWTGLWADAGCIIDPGGRCAPAPSQDEGCIIDPNGGACRDRQ